MTLIACSLLHLAASSTNGESNIQARARAEVSQFLRMASSSGPTASARLVPKPSPLVSSVLKETLRVNPPVMGLPRVVTADEGLTLTRRRKCPADVDQDLHIQQVDPDSLRPKTTSIHLPKGTRFAVDLLSLAHGGCSAGCRKEQQPAAKSPLDAGAALVDSGASGTASAASGAAPGTATAAEAGKRGLDKTVSWTVSLGGGSLGEVAPCLSSANRGGGWVGSQQQHDPPPGLTLSGGIRSNFSRRLKSLLPARDGIFMSCFSAAKMEAAGSTPSE